MRGSYKKKGHPIGCSWGPVQYHLVFLSFKLLFQSPLDLELADISAWYTEYTQKQAFLWQSGMHEVRDSMGIPQHPCLKGLKKINTTEKGKARRMGTIPVLANTTMLLNDLNTRAWQPKTGNLVTLSKHNFKLKGSYQLKTN